jgi:very-short-patch-repair endonuclease
MRKLMALNPSPLSRLGEGKCLLSRKERLSRMAELPPHRSKTAIRKRARELRRRMTPAEMLLWQALRGRRTGFKWRRQHPIGPFIVDFYCAERRLIVEVDGSVHDQQIERDTERAIWLQQHGYTLMRFTNTEVDRDLAGMLAHIQVARETIKD